MSVIMKNSVQNLQHSFTRYLQIVPGLLKQLLHFGLGFSLAVVFLLGSEEATLPFSLLLPFSVGSTVKGKNLIP